jgi:hypothetical protein
MEKRQAQWELVVEAQRGSRHDPKTTWRQSTCVTRNTCHYMLLFTCVAARWGEQRGCKEEEVPLQEPLRQMIQEGRHETLQHLAWKQPLQWHLDKWPCKENWQNMRKQGHSPRPQKFWKMYLVENLDHPDPNAFVVFILQRVKIHLFCFVCVCVCVCLSVCL